jgi:hypothetical protein
MIPRLAAALNSGHNMNLSMQWLLHGFNSAAAVGEALARHEHRTHSIAELEIPPEATPAEIVSAAGKRQWDICTCDADLVHAAQLDPGVFKRCIVFLQLEGGDVERDDAIDRLFARYPRLSPGRIYTVTGSRVKIRQLPRDK